MSLDNNFPNKFPNQHQSVQPGIENIMNPLPIYEKSGYTLSDKTLKNKVAIITGGDSGIGRAISLAFAKQGADIVIVHLNEEEDVNFTKELVENTGRKCITLRGDIAKEDVCMGIVSKAMQQFGKIDILVNNAAEQHWAEKIENITKQQLERTFETNFFGAFYMTKSTVPHMKRGASIINTTSITAYKGHKNLIDYSCSKGALVTFTRSLAMNLISKGIRVNAVAPGPIWTPLIPSSMDEEQVSKFGNKNPLKRAGQPVEVAQAYVFLASDASSYIIGETIHVNGGEFINC